MKLFFLICLISSFPFNFQSPLFSPELRLISTSESQSAWLTELEIFNLYKEQKKFIDVTDGVYYSLPSLNQNINPLVFPTKATRVNETRSLFDKISSSRMKSFLTKFTSFKTRYYKSATGQGRSPLFTPRFRPVVIRKSHRII